MHRLWRMRKGMCKEGNRRREEEATHYFPGTLYTVPLLLSGMPFQFGKDRTQKHA